MFKYFSLFFLIISRPTLFVGKPIEPKNKISNKIIFFKKLR